MSEREVWRTTTYLLLAVSLVIGVIQRTQYQFLDELFEIFIFHIPTLLAFVIYSKAPQS